MNVQTNDYAGLVNSLINVTARLIDIMGHEIELLERRNARDLVTLQSEKSTLVRAYDEQMSLLRQDPERVSTLEPVLRDELWRVSKTLDAMVEENARALRATMEANNRLVRVVIRTAQEETQRDRPYTRRRQIDDGAGDPARKPLSLAVDRQL